MEEKGIYFAHSLIFFPGDKLLGGFKKKNVFPILANTLHSLRQLSKNISLNVLEAALEDYSI